MQKSYRAPNPGDKRPWFIIDAKDQPIGRLAVVIANKLRAKDLPTFDPSVDAGAFVIVTNAALVKLRRRSRRPTSATAATGTDSRSSPPPRCARSIPTA